MMLATSPSFPGFAVDVYSTVVEPQTDRQFLARTGLGRRHRKIAASGECKYQTARSDLLTHSDLR